MATISSKVQVTMLTTSGNKQSFNIDNPRENTTLTSIRLALAPAIDTNSWCATSGMQFIRVNNASIIETEKTKLSDEGTSVEIVPTEATIEVTGAETVGTQNFVVTGMTIKGYRYQFLNGEETITPNISQTTINTTANTIQAAFNTPSAGTAFYNFIITSGEYTFALPITITKS